VRVSAAQAIAQGISREAGLFVPESLPRLSEERLRGLVELEYVDRACDILGDFLTDFTAGEIRACVEGAYGGGKFDNSRIAPLSKLCPDAYLLELWHGPTCAFKDMALQLLPHLLTRSGKKVADGREICILVATSGDTGKAALEGFRDVDGTRILVFYPRDGVSDIQKLQMTTQQGGNVGVWGVEGNFDDTQSFVKSIFTDKDIRARLESHNMSFSSANSINWGRLAPQIVYYISAYCDLVAGGEIAFGDVVNAAVPTGNFGNILAAYYAKKMGLPLGKLLCASNINNVLTDFIRTGTYDRRRQFHATSSPSMDILISSNLERMLFALSDGDDKIVTDLMGQLAQNGCYTVSGEMRDLLQSELYGGFCDEARTARTIKKTFEEYSYLCDTHTAVALAVLEQYVRETGNHTKTIVASTANPYKFAGSILTAITGRQSGEDEFAQINELSALTGTAVPPQILELRNSAVRFGESCTKDGMRDAVLGMLKIK